MFVRLTPSGKFICDRCGKEVFTKDDGYFPSGSIHDIGFRKRNETMLNDMIAEGSVCTECLNDFVEIALNFFDEVNKTESEGKG